MNAIATPLESKLPLSSVTDTKAQLIDRIQHLECAVSDMDCLSQNGLRQIVGIAKLALAAMENPATYSAPESIAQALSAIWELAETTECCISSNATDVGCSYHNDAYHRRLAARFVTKEA